MLRALFLCLMAPLSFCADVEPVEAVLAGIARVETRSIYQDAHVVRYVDRRDGEAGEVSPFQLAPSVCRQWHFNRARLRTDLAYAKACAVRHLRWLRANTDSWFEAVCAYHVGLSAFRSQAGMQYARKVLTYTL